MAGVVLKLLRVVHWQMKAKGVLTIPLFLMLLVATQMRRKLRKWLDKRASRPTAPPASRAAAPLPAHAPSPHSAASASSRTGA